MTLSASLSAYVAGIGVLGPGLSNWETTAAVLAKQTPYVAARTVLPAPAALPPAERRRTGGPIKLALATGFEAVANAGIDTTTLPIVYGTSDGDGHNCHAICEALASSDRAISPIRFHNSVHNAPTGYWSIAAQAMAASITISAYDATFSACLLEALVQLNAGIAHVGLIVCDTDYPDPLRATRPIPDAFGVALILTANKTANTIARLNAGLITNLNAAPADKLDNPELETLRASSPPARSLPLLNKLAHKQTGRVVLEYLDSAHLAVELS